MNPINPISSRTTNFAEKQNTSTLIIRQPDDWHVHLRDGEVLNHTVLASAHIFARAMLMPNLKPPITTVAEALAYQNRVLKALQGSTSTHLNKRNSTFMPLMSLYLTDSTPPTEVERVKESGVVLAFKLYPAGATTNSASGVTNLKKIYPTLAMMERLGIYLQVHGEVTDPQSDVFDRENLFIDQVLIPLRKDFPELKVVFEHITTKAAAQYVSAAEGFIAATITPQHLLENRNAIFRGGIRPHYYCLPILKREEDRQALLKAATSGNPRFFLGTDSAPHEKNTKENACGCAGCFTAPHAMALYATAFEQVNLLDKLENFTSVFGAQFYHQPLNSTKIRLERTPINIPDVYPLGSGYVVPFWNGIQLPWRVQVE
jgi:dihydroorotase